MLYKEGGFIWYPTFSNHGLTHYIVYSFNLFHKNNFLKINLCLINTGDPRRACVDAVFSTVCYLQRRVADFFTKFG